MKTKFVITIPVRNANIRAASIQIGHLDPDVVLPTSYIERALRSAVQDYDDYRIIVRDDASTDGTWEIIQEVAPTLGVPIDIAQNTERLAPCGNHYQMAQLVEDDEVIVNLDGDDQLSGRNVLSILNEVYADPAVWMTYGSYGYDEVSRDPRPGIDYRGICSPMVECSRKSDFRCSHLRTYKRWLFDRINVNDLKYRGEFYPVIGDLAIMFPMIEMSGHAHSRYIHDILYLYNTVNP